MESFTIPNESSYVVKHTFIDCPTPTASPSVQPSAMIRASSDGALDKYRNNSKEDFADEEEGELGLVGLSDADTEELNSNHLADAEAVLPCYSQIKDEEDGYNTDEDDTLGCCVSQSGTQTATDTQSSTTGKTPTVSPSSVQHLILENARLSMENDLLRRSHMEAMKAAEAAMEARLAEADVAAASAVKFHRMPEEESGFNMATMPNVRAASQPFQVAPLFYMMPPHVTGYDGRVFQNADAGMYGNEHERGVGAARGNEGPGPELGRRTRATKQRTTAHEAWGGRGPGGPSGPSGPSGNGVEAYMAQCQRGQGAPVDEEAVPDIPETQQERDVPGNTTVMLRNVPNNYTRAMFLSMLDSEGFSGAYDFVYLPIDFNSQACLGYAFVDLRDTSCVQRFWQKFDGFSKWCLPSKKVCKVNWSGPHQGLAEHIERYRNSPVMHASVPDEFKPMLFENGVRVPFPPPTKSNRPPRVRGSPGEHQSATFSMQHGVGHPANMSNQGNYSNNNGSNSGPWPFQPFQSGNAMHTTYSAGHPNAARRHTRQGDFRQNAFIS